MTQTIQSNRAIVEAILQTFPAPVESAEMLIPMAEIGKNYLTETLGIQEAYFVLNLRIGSFAFIFPQTGNINTETLQQVWESFTREDLEARQSRCRKYVLILPRMRNVTDEERYRFIDTIIPATPANRPDFAEAFAATENSPIQIAIALPDFVRRVVRDTAPRLPAPFERLDIATPLSQLRWLATGIEPATSSINVTAAMTSDLAALNAQQNFRETVAFVIENMPTAFPISPVTFVERPEIRENLLQHRETVQNLLALTPEGRNLTLRWEKPQFDAILEMAMPLLTELAMSEAERMARAPCIDKMRMLILAFHNYAAMTDTPIFPPPFTVDDDGNPLHSWRVLILPWVDQVALYRQIRLDEPWDSEHNRQFHDKMPAIFRCPASTLGNPNRDTVYSMVVGDQTIGVPNGRGISFHRITDGTSNTIAIVERKTPVNWMSPVDVLQEHAYLGVNVHEYGIGSEHAGGVLVGFADGSVRFMSESIPLEILITLLMKASGRGGDPRDFLEPMR